MTIKQGLMNPIRVSVIPLMNLARAVGARLAAPASSAPFCRANEFASSEW